jgi:hypothetical protein
MEDRVWNTLERVASWIVLGARVMALFCTGIVSLMGQTIARPIRRKGPKSLAGGEQGAARKERTVTRAGETYPDQQT